MLAVLGVFMALAWGTLAATRLEGARPLAERLGLGLAIGLAVLLWSPFVLGVPLGLLGGGIASLLATSALLGYELRRNRAGVRLLLEELAAAFRPGRRAASVASLVVASSAIGFLTYLAATHSFNARPDGLYTAGYGFGDMAMHATFANAFRWGPGFVPPRYPLFAGWLMTYPFVPDFAVASLDRLGLPLGGAFTLTLAIALAALFLLAVSLGERWTGRGRLVGFLTAALFFASGGLGVWQLVARLLTSIPFEAALMASDLTQSSEDGLILNNVTNGILLPARNAAFGMALGAAVLVLLTPQVGGPRARKSSITAGVLTGLLPMVHTHSFLTVGFTVVVWTAASILLEAARTRTEIVAAVRGWYPALVPIAVLALPQIVWIKLGLSLGGGTSFAHAQLGWESHAFEDQGGGAPGLGWSAILWLWFWFKNAGFFGLLSVVALFLGTMRERALVLPFAAIFVLCNIGRIQPWEHDSVKLFAWVWLAFAPLVAGLLARAWRTNLSGKVLAIQGVILCLATGTLVLWREARLELRLLDARGVAFAEEVKKRTPPDAIILTASTHNHPVPLLTGRSVVLGYKGWLWPHGVPYQTRETAVAQIYEGRPTAKGLIAQLHVEWIVVGPDERREFARLDERVLRQLCDGPPFISGEWELYKVKAP